MIMAYPTWLAYFFSALMAVVAVYCVVRIALARPRGKVIEYDVDISHLLMAVAMIGMLVPKWNKISNTVWVVVFFAFLVWFAAKALVEFRSRSHMPAPIVADHVRHNIFHGVMALAMLDMYWIGMPMSASPHGAAMSSMSGAQGNAFLNLLVVVALLGFTIWEIDSAFVSGSATVVLAGAGGETAAVAVGNGHGPTHNHLLQSPKLEAVIFTVMTVTMAFSIILMF